MQLALNIILITTLILVVYQDLRYREIHVLLPVVLGITGVIQFLFLEQPISEIVTIIIFLILILTGLLIYVSVKSKKIVNPIDSFIGLGDIVFFIAIIPLFFSTTYILFFSTGMLFSIACHFIFSKNKENDIPLAGYLSIYLILLFSINFLTKNELFYTHQIF